MSHDTIKAYLDSPLVPDEEIKAAGGVLKYWELARATCPRVAQMLSFCAWSVLNPTTPTRLHTNLISVPPTSFICRRRTLFLVWTTASESPPAQHRIPILQGSDGDRIMAPDTSPFDRPCNECHSGWYEPQSREGKITGGGQQRRHYYGRPVNTTSTMQLEILYETPVGQPIHPQVHLWIHPHPLLAYPGRVWSSLSRSWTPVGITRS